MAEELRFFLRTAIYSAVIGIVYWAISYEVAGSVMLAAVVLATGLVVGAVLAAVRAARGELDAGGRGPLTAAARIGMHLFGFGEPRSAALEEPLAAGLDALPSSSPWPLMGGVGAMLAGLGLVYGPWLLLPGLVIVVLTVWGWIVQLDSPR